MTIPIAVDLLRRFVLVRRRELNLDQYDVAAAANVSKGLISMLEAGKVKSVPRVSNLVKLANGLRVDLDILIQLSQGNENQTVIDDGGILKPIPANMPPHLQALGRPLLDPEREAEAHKKRRRPSRPPIPAEILDTGFVAAQEPSLPAKIRESGPVSSGAKADLADVQRLELIPGSHPRSIPRTDFSTLELGSEETVGAAEVLLFGQVGCARFLNLDGNPIEIRKIPARLARGGDGLVDAVGDSMVGAGIHPGMTLVVKRQSMAENGQVVLANIPYLGTAVRRLKVTQDGPYLISQGANAYPPIKLEGEIRIVGRVLRAFSEVSFE